jgi:hypothetical protein
MLARHVGREQDITDAAGRRWRLGRWTRSVWASILAWARPLVPDPFDVAKKALAAFPEHLHAGIVDDAVERASIPYGIGHPGVQQAVSSIEGTAFVVQQLLLAAHPDATLDDAFDLAADMGFKETNRRLKIASGETPPDPAGNGAAPPAS